MPTIRFFQIHIIWKLTQWLCKFLQIHNIQMTAWSIHSFAHISFNCHLIKQPRCLCYTLTSTILWQKVWYASLIVNTSDHPTLIKGVFSRTSILLIIHTTRWTDSQRRIMKCTNRMCLLRLVCLVRYQIMLGCNSWIEWMKWFNIRPHQPSGIQTENTMNDLFERKLFEWSLYRRIIQIIQCSLHWPNYSPYPKNSYPESPDALPPLPAFYSQYSISLLRLLCLHCGICSDSFEQTTSPFIGMIFLLILA